MADSLGIKSVEAFLWAGIDKLGNSVLNFLLTIVLARLLSPEDFGLVAMVLVFFDISSVFVESGFSAALIREKNISEADKSTAFIFNLVSSVLIYIALFLAAPFIAAFFRQELLTAIVRVMGLNLIINAIGIIQFTAFTQQINFRVQTKIRFLAVIVSGAGALTLAFLGYGVWSLVGRALLTVLVSTIVVWYMSSWRPSWHFSRDSFKKLFGFGSAVLLIALIDKFFRNLFDLLIGRYFSAASLGFYKQADNFRNMAGRTLLQTVKQVTYPVLSKLKDDKVKLKEGYRKVIKLSSFVIFPAMAILACLAEPIILTFVGEKWLPSVPLLQLLSLAGITYHINSLNYNILLVLGKTRLSLKLEIIKKANILVAVLIGLPFGLYGLVLAQVASSFIELFINAYYSRKLIDYGLLEQIKDVSTSLAFSLFMGVVMGFVSHLFMEQGILSLASGLAAGLLIYGGLHVCTATEENHIIRSFILPKAVQIISKTR